MKSCLLLHSYNYYRLVCYFTLSERRRTMFLRGQRTRNQGILLSRSAFSVAVVTSSRQTTEKGGENDTVEP